MDNFASGNRWEPVASDRHGEDHSHSAPPRGADARPGARRRQRRWSRRRPRWQALASVALAGSLGAGVAAYGLAAADDHGRWPLPGVERHESESHVAASGLAAKSADDDS